MEKYKYRHFLTCCIAGLTYHDADSIMDELQEGDKVVLVRQKDNRYDSNAVAVTLPDGYNGNPDEFDFDNILGYIPRECNAQLATMLDMGWTDLLNAEIMEIKHHAAYTDRICIAVYIRSKEQHSIPDRPLWAIELTTKDSWISRHCYTGKDLPSTYGMANNQKTAIVQSAAMK